MIIKLLLLLIIIVTLSAGWGRQNHKLPHFLAQREAFLRWAHEEKLIQHSLDAAPLLSTVPQSKHLWQG